MTDLTENIKGLLHGMQERMKYLQSKEAKKDRLKKVQIGWSIYELALSIITVQRMVLLHGKI